MQSMGFKSSGEVISHAIRTEGITAFYKGSLVPLMLNSPACSVLISSYGTAKRQMAAGGVLNASPILQNFVAGGVGGSCMSLVATPMEHIRIRMQTQIEGQGVAAYSGSLDATMKIFRSHGISGIYKGATVTLIRDAFGFACYFAAYDTIKKMITGNSDKPPSTVQTLSAGSVAVALWSARYPLDTVKTRIQADSITRPQYRGMIDCFSKTVAKEGVGALYAGFAACILRTVPVNAGFFWAYETSSYLFDVAMGSYQLQQ